MDNTDPTRPTPPPAPTLAPVAAPPAALVVPGSWQIEGLPDIVRRAGPQAAERTVEFLPPRSATRTRARRTPRR